MSLHVFRLSSANLRKIPSVNYLLEALGPVAKDLPRPAIVALIRRELAAYRKNSAEAGLDKEHLLKVLADAVEQLRRERLQPVINGTGIIIHTNLGRAPLGPAVAKALVSVAQNYTTLEYDLVTGERGPRAPYLEQTLALLIASEATTIVNNCAAALVLLVRHFTRTAERHEVIVSRGELVQIGGGFRIPEILEASGANLHEVGTTNQTDVSDYARAINQRTALILKVHRSNFYIEGFTHSAAPEEIAAVAREAGIPFVEDLGSGAVFDTDAVLGDGQRLDHERRPAEALAQGVDVICFSGDKLFGGPQAGILAGSSAKIRALKHDPLFRAFRCDKLVLASLEATVDLYLRNALPEIPVQRMLAMTNGALAERAAAIIASLRDVPISAKSRMSKAQVGGGTLPRCTIESLTLELSSPEISASELAARLRQAVPPVIGYIADDCYRLDLRTIFPEQDQLLEDAIRAAVSTSSEAAPQTDEF